MSENNGTVALRSRPLTVSAIPPGSGPMPAISAAKARASSTANSNRVNHLKRNQATLAPPVGPIDREDYKREYYGCTETCQGCDSRCCGVLSADIPRLHSTKIYAVELINQICRSGQQEKEDPEANECDKGEPSNYAPGIERQPLFRPRHPGAMLERSHCTNWNESTGGNRVPSNRVRPSTRSGGKATTASMASTAKTNATRSSTVTKSNVTPTSSGLIPNDP